MVDFNIGVQGAQTDLLKTYHADGVFRAEIGVNRYIYKMVQGIQYSLDESNQDEEYIDNGKPVFSRIGDIRGQFQVTIKKHAGMFETGDTPADDWLVSKWLADIEEDDPPEVDFVETMHADKAASNKFARVKLKLRIRNVMMMRDPGRGSGDIAIGGQVIGLSYAKREAS